MASGWMIHRAIGSIVAGVFATGPVFTAQPTDPTSSGQASTSPRPEAVPFTPSTSSGQALRQVQGERSRALEGSGQAYPVKPVRLVIAQSAGGNADFVARAYAQRLGERFGQQIVVDNRPGGAGIIGSEI